jgi:hypothetical protein
VQIYCPDELNLLQATIDFSGPVQDVALNFREFASIGAPSTPACRYVRLASLNKLSRDVRMYVGGVRWLYGETPTSVPQYLTVSGNRWDGFYFGGNRDRVLFKPTGSPAPAYATATVDRSGTYDVVARVQDARRSLSMRISVDGRVGRCSSTGGRGDETERLVRLTRLPLARGTHVLAISYCNNPSSGVIGIGVQSIIVAAARLQPPAFRGAGRVNAAGTGPGTLRLATTGNYLVFTDSFDNRWSATQNGVSLPHLMANGYANAWRVSDPSAGDIVLQFWPQRSFEFGIAVSLGLAAACLVVIGLTLWEARATSARASLREHVIGG